MTFTILGRNPQTGELGIAIATYSLAVGATCPQILPGIGVATSQASTNPAIGEEIMELLEDATQPAEAFIQAFVNDEHQEFRQIAFLAPTGDPIVHSGDSIKPFSGHVIAENCVAVGNFLANENVLQAMVDGFSEPDKNTDSAPTLADRLLSALDSGKQAGGQSSADASHLPERSACLLIGAPGEPFPIDIRIDVSTNAIPELRTAYETYLPMHDYYLNRAENPTDLPSQDEWAKQLETN
jgi:uncharacterized Ntn-hydrolase superfamily protein